MPATATRAVTYCRISHDPTGLEAGVDRQQVDTDRLAAERGWLVVERVVDNDRSASRYAKRGREGWAAVMALVEGGEVEAVVAYDLDRLTRQPKELERLIDAAEKGLAVVTAGGMIDLASAGGRMVARTLCAVAAHEADRIRDRIKTKLRHDAENGRPHWVRRPFGYNLDGTVVPDEADWLRQIHRWIIDDGISAMETARRLNAANVGQATGAAWQSAGVKMLVSSPRNHGMRTYHGKIVGPGTWPGIVTEADWKAASSALAVRSQGTRSGRRSMLTGMVRCGVCGQTMTRTNTGPRAEWRCTKHADVGTGCGQSIMALALEAHVVDMVLVRVGDVRGATVVPSAGPDADSIRSELQELADMVARGDLSMTEWKTMREPLSARLQAAEALAVRHDADIALTRLVGETATLAERWADIVDVDLKRRIIGLVLDHVTVAAARRRGRIDLDRIVPTWK